MITLLVCSRWGNNPNSNIEHLFATLQANTADLKDLKVLVKTDEDDDYPAITMMYINCVVIKTPRRRGYISIHEGYKDLVPFIPKESNLIGAVADDFVAEPNWDVYLKQEYSKYAIIHGKPCPLIDYNNIDSGGQYIDEAPFWTRGVLEAVDFDWTVSFTDAWTVAIEYFLKKDFKTSITHITEKPLFGRQTCDLDGPDNLRWLTDRKENFDLLKTQTMKDKLRGQAEKIYKEMKNA